MDKLIRKLQILACKKYIPKKYKKYWNEKRDIMWAMDYSFTEVIYYYLKLKKKVGTYAPYYSSNSIDHIKHWWLQNEEGDIIEPMKGYYTDKELQVFYKNGKKHNFATPVISNKNKELLSMIRILNLVELKPETSSKRIDKILESNRIYPNLLRAINIIISKKMKDKL